MLSPIPVGVLLEVLLLWLAWFVGLASRSYGFLLAAALLVGLIAGVMLRRRLAAIVAGAVPSVAFMIWMLSSGTS